jgi:hypothetical protein
MGLSIEIFDRKWWWMPQIFAAASTRANLARDQLIQAI